jgi:hypothetical protein
VGMIYYIYNMFLYKLRQYNINIFSNVSYCYLRGMTARMIFDRILQGKLGYPILNVVNKNH